jgi:hypothetical protein
MNRIVSIALAGAVAATSLGTASGTASAGWRPHPNYYWQPHYRPAPAPDAGGALAAGLLFGLAFGAIASAAAAPPAPYYDAPPPAYGVGWGEHVAWCRANYPAYNINTDTFIDVNGYVHACVGPY